MKVWRYSRWDGTQQEFTLDPKEALDALSELLMEGLSVDEALEWMRRGGFPLAGMNFRVMGTEELAQELRQQARELMQQYSMDQATDELGDGPGLVARVLEAFFGPHAPLQSVLGNIDPDAHGHGKLSGATNSGSRIRARVSGPGDRSSFAAAVER